MMCLSPGTNIEDSAYPVESVRIGCPDILHTKQKTIIIYYKIIADLINFSMVKALSAI